MTREKTRGRVIAVIRQEGFHHWPNAPQSVGFLSARHRHLFTVRAEVDVTEPDRQEEFILLGREVRRRLIRKYGNPLELGSCSCEMLCEALLEDMPRLSAVEAWEDDENGARVERTVKR